MKSVPVLDMGDGKIDNIITQSAVIHMLAECTGLHWFESWGTKKLSEIGLPTMSPKQIITVSDCYLYLRLFMSISMTHNALLNVLILNNACEGSLFCQSLVKLHTLCTADCCMLEA